MKDLLAEAGIGENSAEPEGFTLEAVRGRDAGWSLGSRWRFRRTEDGSRSLGCRGRRVEDVTKGE
ncbi:hypothetical protein K0M31_017151 [Melipona bicolor]|uniref:Uncharacterized protein n=1 Tax=Melipona bicolor TaxID=60889 RepID=A0AA40KE27_9HYME|nr:hypothetical protein K0M31_017151 [Melipona bicolor]